MFQQYFQHRGLVTLPILTMLLFAAVFLAVILRVLRRIDEQLASLPLEEGHRTQEPRFDEPSGGGDHG